MTKQTNVDVLIIGAGLSGIGTACHLSEACPHLEVAIVERRSNMGGTWDLFRYPGIRSDSDMFSFGYQFRPWNELKVLADGPSIRRYIQETAKKYAVDDQIHYGLRTLEADWSHADRRWTVTAEQEASGERHVFHCRFLIGCTGYYNYDQGYLPDFPGRERFRGQCIHPQQWPEDLDYQGKKVVVIGSGATAVTLVPAMAPDVEQITMLQRSPSYIFSIPGYDIFSAGLKKALPEDWVYRLARWRNIKLQQGIYKTAKRWPRLTRQLLMGNVKRHLGKNVDISHFDPDYMPWDERLCAVPDADLFKDLRAGRAAIVTDQIDTFTETGIRLQSGKELEADIIITATGLNVQVLGGMDLKEDGEPVDVSQRMTYKGVLMEGLPNMAWIFGYTNASWTLKADIAGQYVCRLLNYMTENQLEVATPHDPEDNTLDDTTVMDALQSGYVKRAKHVLPRQGAKPPWRVLNQYKRDSQMLLTDPIDDGLLVFSQAQS